VVARAKLHAANSPGESGQRIYRHLEAYEIRRMTNIFIQLSSARYMFRHLRLDRLALSNLFRYPHFVWCTEPRWTVASLIIVFAADYLVSDKVGGRLYHRVTGVT